MKTKSPQREVTLETLRTRKSQLTQKMDAIKADIRRGLDRDSEERALQLENREVLEEIGRVTSEELAKVEAEIARSTKE